jgi:Pyruvate/2-oxoacid:ferredoxin oxidoreductase delta subunit
VNRVTDWTRKELEKKLSNIKTAVTIPVNLHIEDEQRILDLREMRRILGEAKLIAVSNCSCREKVRGCDAPLDVCFSIDERAEEFVKEGIARKINLKDALDALRRSHEAGLVHMTLTYGGREKAEVICSCCSCCCHSLSALIRFGMPDAVIVSKYVATFNSETCINCGKCVVRCQFRARWMVNGKVKYDKTRCFGCGLCVSTCPTGSTSLVPRVESSRDTLAKKRTEKSPVQPHD